MNSAEHYTTRYLETDDRISITPCSATPFR